MRSKLVLVTWCMLAAGWTSALAQGVSPPLPVQETNIQGVVAELAECSRKEGVLTVKLRFRGSSDKKPYLMIDTHHGAYDGFYVVGANKKYFVLKDAEGAPLAPKYLGGVNLGKDEVYNWWAKFPAPPAEVKKVKLIIPQVMPFEDVAVTDK
ncbi:MAG: hypothetical protein HY777_04795 [Betaproteobacteria bacterium]|nr:hypothetical protein [Betaproteobacteria bacterium]